MDPVKPDSADYSELRFRAETQLKKSQIKKAEFTSSPDEMRRLIHELSVHQIELEIQQEELDQSRLVLEKSLQRYTNLYDFAPTGYLTLSRESKIVEGNLAAAKLLGLSRSRLQGKYLVNYISIKDRSTFADLLERAFQMKESSSCEVSLKRDAFRSDEADTGAFETGLISVRMDAVVNDRSTNCNLVFTDITRERRAEQDVVSSNERMQFILKETHAGIWEWDIKTNTNFWSTELWQMYGLDPNVTEASYDAWAQSIMPEERGSKELIVQNAINKNAPFTLEWRVNHSSVKNRWLLSKGIPFKDSTGKVSRYVGIVVDITEQKQIEDENYRLETQLLQSQKMEMLGTFAGGIAHDFNNMLGVILGHTEMLLDDLGHSDIYYKDLDAIREAATRSADLTQQLLAFARKQNVLPKVFQLNTAVEKILPMLRRLIGENITLHYESGTKNTKIKIDPSQIDQILVNLAVNARDAITGSGKITIKISQCNGVDTGMELSNPSVEYIALSVSDDGCGMDKNNLPHIFEPFFTTKEQGKGTGLGLSTIYGIVKQNNGRIDCQSEPGKGTTITIYLPMNREQSEAEANTHSQTSVYQGNQTILIVEDEPGILKLCKLILERKGYKVLTAETPRKAITLADNCKERLDLLLTDVIMPEMNGKDLSEIFLTAYPDIKILFMSGYTADALGRNSELQSGPHFIKKPFTVSSLTKAVYETLNHPGLT
jgi:two-component system cell cycle sensor histidine kinase/response regulator CckA